MALLAALACLYGAAHLMLQGSGFFPRPTWQAIVQLAFLIIVFNASRKLFYFVLLPFVLLHAFYTPVGMTFGPPSYQYVASVFATDLMESREFMAQLPFSDYLAALAIVVLVLAFRFITQKFKLRLYHNKFLLALMIVVTLWSTASLKFVQEGTTALIQVEQELSRLNAMSIQSEWGESTLTDASKYDDYVLIIGESARKDYHHAYGYPADNTPFMSHANGILIDGFTSGGTNTIASLKLMLTKPDTQTWQGNYALNVIDLVKSAGYKTYWISNQGYLGEFDTPISAIANKSDETIFLKSGDSANSNTSDFALLPRFAQVLDQPTADKRFIVLHLYGSHPITCDRLNDYPKIYPDEKVDKKYFNVNCYVSSIKKTDEVIRRVYEELVKNEQKSHRTFSMIYFSDHGLAHHTEHDGVITLHNSNGASKRHYDIPLFRISSDDSERHEYKVFKSGLNFTDGIGHWLGIRNDKLNAAVDLFSNWPDPDDYGLKTKIRQMIVPDDPAVVIPLKP
ncbi:phosphoethanolamine transferase [Pasteurellaceae bacterium LIM206]|nr:phosphoethanolamine transferase [Pasteurellaceae bacterium LIM206]